MTSIGQRPTEVVVVGGGIGGLCAALALAKTGREVTVVERSDTFAEIGAGLQIAPNATRVLRWLGVLDRCVELGVTPRNLVARSAVTGAELTSVSTSGLLETYGSPYIVMHRADLLGVLLEACAAEPTISLVAGRTVDSVETDPDEAAVRCTDGTLLGAKVVIGADGLHSRMRQLVVDDSPINSGFVAYRGAVPAEAVPDRPPMEDVTVWIGPDLHLVQYPLRADGSVYNQVAVFRSYEYDQGVADWGGPDELQRRFEITRPEVQAALVALEKDRRWEMHDREPLDGWSTGRLTLLGDAAHPMLQYLAQGSCQALEDAQALAMALAEHIAPGWPPAAVTRAFSAYERARTSRAALVQRVARTWGEIWHVDGVAMALRDECFELRQRSDYRRLDWLYGASEREYSGNVGHSVA